MACGVGDMGMQWEAVPTKCQWRNGGAEIAIQMAKRTLKKKLDVKTTLDFQELQATFH